MPKRIFATPDEAELAFYEAMARADFPAMQAIWSDHGDLVCVHPMGPRLVGRTAIMKSWSDMFAHGEGVRIERYSVQRIHTNSIAIHSLFEIIAPDTDQRRYPPIIATNVYQRTDSGWHMVLHQAGPGSEMGAKHAANEPDPEREQFH